MDPQPQAPPPPPPTSASDLTARIPQHFPQLRQDVTQRATTPGPGRVIPDSREEDRDLLARCRQQTYQAAVQLRLEAAQAASPPSGPPQDSQAPAEQGP